jgi:D-alanyl-D-alanine dipeptidase
MKRLLLLLLLICSLSLCSQNLPEGFSYLSDIDSTIETELRYMTKDNFLGKPVDGYDKNVMIVSTKAGKAIKKVQAKLAEFGLSLKVFDGYRPQRSVDHFVRWAKVLNDTLTKQKYYPNVAKKDLFKLDYIASRSSHTRGAAIDLTIIDKKTGKELDMGSGFDYFGNPSHPTYPNLTEKQRSNRLLLRNLMMEAGFKPYSKEWWHFGLKDEPFPNTYFNFPIR